MVNGTSLTLDLLQGREPVGTNIHVNIELVEGGVFLEGDRGLVRRSWVDGSEERIWKPSLRICLRRRRLGH